MTFKGATAAIMVFAIDDGRSFTQVKDYWSDLVDELCPTDVIKFVVGNKIDNEEHRIVEEEAHEAYADDNEMKMYETSARTNLEGVDKLFSDLFYEIAQKLIKDTTKLNRPQSQNIHLKAR